MQAFLAMCGNPEWNAVRTMVRQVCEANGIALARPNELPNKNNIHPIAHLEIEHGDIFIVDFSGHPRISVANPDVVNLASYARGLRKPAIVITQSLQAIPSEWMDCRSHLYKNTEQSLQELADVLKTKLAGTTKKCEVLNLYKNLQKLRTGPFAGVPADFSWSCELTDTSGQSPITVQEFRHNFTGMKFILVPGGTFPMGVMSYEAERPVRLVEVKPFLLAKSVVTQSMWKKIMATEPWKRKPYVLEEPNCPAIYVSWLDAKEFCRRMACDLPSEAQWEFACRTGTISRYYWGNDMGRNNCWYYGNAKLMNEWYAHEVEKKKANPFGLHDMLGNVWEWCEDTWHPNYKGAPTQCTPWVDASEPLRVIRGGSWCCWENCCTSTIRDREVAEARYSDIGFRVVKQLRGG